MWSRIIGLIIRHRAWLLALVGIITVFMGYKASQARIAYEFVSTLPKTDIEQQELMAFRARFGEDGNIVAVGVKDPRLFELCNFQAFQTLCNAIADMKGVRITASLPQMKRLEKDMVAHRFVFADIFPQHIQSQAQLDTLIGMAKRQKLYADQIINMENGATALLVTINDKVLNSQARDELLKQIAAEGERFTTFSGIELRYAGLPIIRSVITEQIALELKALLICSVIITGLALYFFFRSLTVVFLSMTVISVAVVWSLGTIVLLGYKLTLLSGMIPPIMVVIGIPNAIYLINRYHVGYVSHKNKELALARVIQRVGVATFLTNLTTAIGFLVLLSTQVPILQEFGIVAGINVMALFMLSIVLIPGLLSYTAAPSARHTQHLEMKFLNGALAAIDRWVHNRRPTIYAVSAALLAAAVVGILQLNSLSFISDDLPKRSRAKSDLLFFEQNFNGAMPLEVMVDTHRARGLLRANDLQKIDELEQFLAGLDEVSNPISLIGLTKAARQAFYNDNPARYTLPDSRDRPFIASYMKGQLQDSSLLKSFVDPSFRFMRISYRMLDVGSKKMDSLVNDVIRPHAKKIFKGTSITASVTGTTPVFVQGNKFLIYSLRSSMLQAFGLIAAIMGLMFFSLRMVMVSLIPNLIPMMLTAGIMGYMGVVIEPSTALIFSIIFGISIDFSIHFLTKYHQELQACNQSVSIAISHTIREVGKSMVYTSIVLFCGFIIFGFSGFKGTRSLGLLTSTTLAMSMVTNLIVMPTLVILFNRKKYIDSQSRDKASHKH